MGGTATQPKQDEHTIADVEAVTQLPRLAEGTTLDHLTLARTPQGGPIGYAWHVARGPMVNRIDDQARRMAAKLVMAAFGSHAAAVIEGRPGEYAAMTVDALCRLTGEDRQTVRLAIDDLVDFLDIDDHGYKLRREAVDASWLDRADAGPMSLADTGGHSGDHREGVASR